MRFAGVLLVPAVVLALLGGCDRTQEDRAAQAAADAVHQTNKALREAGAKAKQGAKEAGQAVSEVGATAKEGAREAGRALTDGGLTAKVKTALLVEPGVNGADINVDTSGGVVTLSGHLSHQSQVDRAITIARHVEGVKAVESKLQVAAAE